jgi:hypothetical protein
MKKQTARTLRLVSAIIAKNYGTKCRDYEDGCCVCRVWFHFENMRMYMETAEA